MQTTLSGERTLSELDLARLRRLPKETIPAELADLLNTADVLAQREVCADTITMHSVVEVEDLHTRRRQRLTICYPHDAAPGVGSISVLSPVGSSLLGLRVGEVAKWQLPRGHEGAVRIVAILFQPEASGDYAL